MSRWGRGAGYPGMNGRLRGQRGRPCDRTIGTGRARPGHHPLRRRLRRRHAAHRRPLHQRQRRCSATTWPRCPTSRPRSGPRPAPSPASRPSRSTSPTTTSPRRATRPNVLVAMNPAALQGRAATGSSRAAPSSSTPTPSTSATSTKAGYAANPLTTAASTATRVYEVPMTIAHQGGGQGRSA